MKRLAASTRTFVASDAAGGVALIAANSPLADGYFRALHAEAGPLSVHLWIDDALMAVFLCVVGLQIKSEFVGGLAFPARPDLADQVKIGALAGSLLSAIVGACVLRLAAAKARA